MMRIAVDAMGGDYAPAEIVTGAIAALELLDPADELILIGREDAIRSHLPAGPLDSRVKIVHASDVIGMDETPVEAIRQKKDSSILRMAKLAAEKAVDAVISAGNTGACVAACQLKMRPLPGVSRPGIAVVLPSFHGPVVLCDVGANIAPKPHHLLEYAHLASVYASLVLNIQNPRVGLLSIGEEEVKGNRLVKEARDLIRQDGRLNFIGNIEGRDVLKGAADIAVCDGFVGNIVLKLTEGLSEGLFKTIEKELGDEAPELASAFKPVVRRIWDRHDYSEYGGAPLLGVDGICIICHGSSDRRAIRNAIRAARRYVVTRLNSALESRLSRETANA
ncbi:MAG: phosphate acyltransferase PlsX [Phycisphaerae bacterium]|nr:phosphate acyltransferase PlsX [Phycisphaerae bacterium]